MPKLKIQWDETTTWAAEIEIADDEVDLFRGEMNLRELIQKVRSFGSSQVCARPQPVNVNYESALLSFEIEKADGTKVYMSDRR